MVIDPRREAHHVNFHTIPIFLPRGDVKVTFRSDLLLCCFAFDAPWVRPYVHQLTIEESFARIRASPGNEKVGSKGSANGSAALNNFVRTQ